MNIEKKKKILSLIVDNKKVLIDNLNDNNYYFDFLKFQQNYNNQKINFETKELEVFLSSLLINTMLEKKETIFIKSQEIAKLILISYINTILEQEGIENIVFEVENE